MRNYRNLILLVIVVSLIVNGCTPNPYSSILPTQAILTKTITPATTKSPTSTTTPVPEGKNIMVTSTEDSGPGTLRQALVDAEIGDMITFDPDVFNPKNPEEIELKSGLPLINQGYLTIDASNAGVILDGSQAGGNWTPGIEIESEYNIIRGLQVVHFTGPGILLRESADFNIIGGDHTFGIGPLGQGNLFSDTSDGIGIRGSNNVVIGNLVGTDITGTGKMGNRAPGIFLEENACHNIIGPNNIIAYNGTSGYSGGIEIRSLTANNNTITANSIHDNTAPGIYYNIINGSQTENPTIPYIFDFNLATGTVGGISCSGCEVEIFSTRTTDGEVFEGSATADQNGNFSLSKGQGFTGPSLTATSRTSENNTSVFSAPTSGTQRVLMIQEGNESTRTMFQPKTTSELEDNRIGHIFSNLWENSLPDESWVENEMHKLGAKRIRISINEADSDQVDWSKPELEIESIHDDLISEIASKDITITYRLQFWDKAYHASGGQVVYPRFKTEEQIVRYLDFVKFIVHHFKDRVQYYEIWNEPACKDLPQCIEVDDYINLVRRAIPIIQEEYPEAKIVVGSIAGLDNPEIRDYLFKILESDIMPMVDVVTWHPMFSSSPEYNEQYYYKYPTLLQQFKDTANAHGFKGEFVAEELVYSSPDCYWCNPSDYPYSNKTAAKYYARGIVMNLGLSVSVGVAGNSSTRQPSYNAIQNLCTLMAGAKPEEIPVTMESQATNIKSYGFALPNGDKLLAVWSDGVVINEDPGVPSTITLSGFSDWGATGIDVLNGIEQKLIAGSENGNLLISNFLIKDYPIIFLLTK